MTQLFPRLGLPDVSEPPVRRVEKDRRWEVGNGSGPIPSAQITAFVTPESSRMIHDILVSLCLQTPHQYSASLQRNVAASILHQMTTIRVEIFLPLPRCTIVHSITRHRLLRLMPHLPLFPHLVVIISLLLRFKEHDRLAPGLALHRLPLPRTLHRLHSFSDLMQ